jgi:plastocyanin
VVRVVFSASVTVSVLLAPALSASSVGVQDTVQVRDDEFDPATVPPPGEFRIPGDAVIWDWVDTSNPHNVSQLRGLFRSPISSDPTMTFNRTFSAGSFPYECDIHGSSMSGTVRVVVGQDITPSGLPLIWWADGTTNTGRAFDVQLRIGDGAWRTWKRDTERLKGVFGKNDRPVQIKPGRDYFIRARSQKSLSKPRSVSAWSPPRLID